MSWHGGGGPWHGLISERQPRADCRRTRALPRDRQPVDPGRPDAKRRRQDRPTRQDRAQPRQPRLAFNQETLDELSASIREHGVLQPILVRPIGPNTYQLIAGERRWRASKQAGLDTIPA